MFRTWNPFSVLEEPDFEEVIISPISGDEDESVIKQENDSDDNSPSHQSASAGQNSASNSVQPSATGAPTSTQSSNSGGNTLNPNNAISIHTTVTSSIQTSMSNNQSQSQPQSQSQSSSSQSNPAPNVNTNQAPTMNSAMIPVHIEIPFFSGEATLPNDIKDKYSATIEEFVAQVELISTANKWNDVLCAEMAKRYLRGDALKWMNSMKFFPVKLPMLASWSTLKPLLVERFGLESDALRMLAQKTTLKYKKPEPIKNYQDRIIVYIQQLDAKLPDIEKTGDAEVGYWSGFWRRVRELFIEGLPVDMRSFINLMHKDDDLNTIMKRCTDFVLDDAIKGKDKQTPSGNGNGNGNGSNNDPNKSVKQEHPNGAASINALKKWVKNGNDPKDFDY